MAQPQERQAAFDAVLAARGLSVAEILATAPAPRRPFLERTLLWMVKFDVLRLEAFRPVPEDVA
jgi:hypothetical protein